jgi:zona occludens toxin
MITLVTGTPGHGKTLWLISTLAEEVQRPIYYHGIAELKLPWNLVNTPERYHEELPTGAIFVMDEAQKTFPVRDPKKPVPDALKFLETHRHSGNDIYFITQHPNLIDHHIRRLVGRHIHLHRLFGSKHSTVFEQEKLFDIEDKWDLKQCSKTVFNYPKKSFELYKSAEIHTVKRRIPKAIYAVPPLLLLIGYGIYQVKYKTLGDKQQAAVQERQQTGSSGSSSLTGSPVDWSKALKPSIPGMPYTAPIYAPIAKPVSLPVIAGCVGNDKRCSCYTQQATVIEMTSTQCQFYLKNSVFNPFRRDREERNVPSNELHASNRTGQARGF